MTERPAPHQIGKPREVTLTGMLLPWHNGGVSLIELPGEGAATLRAVAAFSTIDKLREAVRAVDIPCTSVKGITDHWEFLQSIPRELLVVIDPWITPERTTRYMQVLRD